MSYWCADKITVHVTGPEGEREIALDQPLALVGSHARSHIVLGGAEVRKRALLLLAIERGIYVVYLDAEQQNPEERGRWLADGDSIRLGPYTLRAQLASGLALEQPTSRPQNERSLLPIPVLHIYCGALLKDRRKMRYPLLLVGRRPQCALRLLGEVVSSFHCLLYWCEQRLWCIDLASSNGARVGEELIACREIVLGERVEVGEFHLLYYRWSPRTSTPGFSEENGHDEQEAPDSSFDVVLDTSACPNDEDSALGTSIASMPRTSDALRETLREAFADEQAELVRLREELQQERRRTERETQLRAAEVEAQAAQLAAEREALAKERRNWQQQRDALAQELDRQRDELQRRERVGLPRVSALTAANIKQPAPTGDEDSPQAGVVIGRWLEESRFMSAVEECGHQGGGLAQDPAPQSMTLTDENKAEGVVALPASRRNPANKDELTSFVSGRLSDIEDSRRRRMVFVWTAVTMTAVATAAAGFGVWFWLL